MANSIFKNHEYRGPQYWCIKALKWIPVLFILFIIAWSYHAYVVELCLHTVTHYPKRILYLTFFHFFFFMILWAYAQTVLTEVGMVPQEFKLPVGEYERLVHADSEDMQRAILEHFAKNLPNVTKTVRGSVRYCEKCRHIKPDRTHHCSVCGVCVLKMDHHCPWINNCVNYNNYKFFILFLAYAYFYCLFVSTTTLQYFVSYWRSEIEGEARFHVLFLFFVTLMFAISMISLFGYHCYLITLNRTTLEAFSAPIFKGGPDKNGFNLGAKRNIQEVFGTDVWLWLVPVQSSLGNGYVFPVREKQGEGESLLTGRSYGTS